MLDELESDRLSYDVADSSLAALELGEGAFLSHQHRYAVTFPLGTRPPEPNHQQPGTPNSGRGGGRDARNLTGNA